MHRMHHHGFDVNRLYLPRKDWGRELVQFQLFLRTSINGTETYLSNTNEWILKLAEKHRQNKCMYSITSDAKKHLNNIDLSTGNISINFNLPKKRNRLRYREKNPKILMN